MGILRRCGRPPRLGPLIKKPTHECVSLQIVAPDAGDRPGAAGPPAWEVRSEAAAVSRTVTPPPYPLHYRLDRRQPPRIDVLSCKRQPGEILVGEPGTGETEQVICSCRGHGGRCCAGIEHIDGARPR
jgi:hypothetical protein